MDIVFGGGKYGLEAARHLISEGREFVVIDVDENCPVRVNFDLPEYRKGTRKSSFVKGGMRELIDIFFDLQPEYVFPTAPIHVAGAFLMEHLGFEVWYEGVDFALAGIPMKVVVSAGRGSVVVSYNRDRDCIPKCRAPDVCPVTGIKKPAPMYELVRFAVPDGFVIESHYLQPGLGAIRGERLREMVEWAESRENALVATACRCHGVITALRMAER
ncbi:hypothetical protein [Geoglobus acetivorans]|uniref:Uncharacterized protein n=1 Tax=Geoglobus acetivorans TaxID=565033 RepID=A0ABZ3H433_GEOAI|nr:hypothetical protein [Geoglobus acetivorans]